MFEWLVVIILIIFGVALIITEMIFVPGTTIVGLLGLAITGFGIYLGFRYFDTQTGWIIVIAASVVTFAVLVYSLRTGAWQKFALKKAIESHVNEDYKPDIKVGDTGKTVSALRPIGKAEFGEFLAEVRTLDQYIPSGSEVKVTRVKDNKIYVELINNDS